jgi:hypothetical protein
MQVDIGFGDPVIPATEPICIPPILDFPPPQMWGYSRESAIAEKLQSMVRLGEVNSRQHWPPGGPWSAQEKDTEEADAL